MGALDADDDDPIVMTVLKLVFGIAITVAVPFMAYFTIKNYRTASSSNSWPQAQATITRFHITEEPRKGVAYYRPNVEYRFSVEGKDFNGTRLAFHGYDSPIRSNIEEMGVKYAPGTQHAVYYDGADPTQSVIERGVSWLVYLALLVPVVMVIVGPLMIKEQYAMLRSRMGQKKPVKTKSKTGTKRPRRRPSPSSED